MEIHHHSETLSEEQVAKSMELLFSNWRVYESIKRPIKLLSQNI